MASAAHIIEFSNPVSGGAPPQCIHEKATFMDAQLAGSGAAAGSHPHPAAAPVPLVAGVRVFAAPPASLTAWALQALPGALCIYARVEQLPSAGIGPRSRELAAAGVLTLRRRRWEAEASLTEYIARRSGAPMRAALASRAEARLPEDEGLIYDLLVDCADCGEPCPSNETIATLTGLTCNHQRVNDLMSRLVGKGLIMIRRRRAEPIRLVTIADSGRSTGIR